MGDPGMQREEEIVGMDLGFENDGILIDTDVVENVRKLTDVKKLARKNLEKINAKISAIKAYLKQQKSPKSTNIRIKDIRTVKTTTDTQKQKVTIGHRKHDEESTPLQQKQNHSTPAELLRPTGHQSGTSSSFTICSDVPSVPVMPTALQNTPVPLNVPLIFDENTGIYLYPRHVSYTSTGQQHVIRPGGSGLGQIIQPSGVQYGLNLNPNVTRNSQLPMPTRAALANPGYRLAHSSTTAAPSSNSLPTPRIIGSYSLRQTAPARTSGLPISTVLTQNQQWRLQISNQNQRPTAISPKTGQLQQQQYQLPIQQLQQRVRIQQQQPMLMQQQPQAQRFNNLQTTLRMPLPRVQNRRFTVQQQRPLLLKQQARQTQRGPSTIGDSKNDVSQNRSFPIPPPSPVPKPQHKGARKTSTIENTKALQVETPTKESESNNTKTFPSLVVAVKPCLQQKQLRSVLSSSRAELDSKVKSLLMLNPQKFTEWLMQRGLLKLMHTCTRHFGEDKPYKFGMYSDKRQTSSGGYAWIADCCGECKEISVFHGSIFESSIHNPGTVLKLIYHWSCQTSVNSVLQWVPVTSYYLKNLYTLLRSACIAMLHEACPVMGGVGKFVEIGVITIGTTQSISGFHSATHVKVEILGVFDASKKIIRMKVINVHNEDKAPINITRIQQILFPISYWVNKSSTLLIDNSIDKVLLEDMGYRVIQPPSLLSGQSKAAVPTNVNVMNYLKSVVPKMFQTTLPALSKSLVQQFLDELSWREIWGGDPSKTYDNITNQLAHMTKWDTGESLISRLNTISLDPFSERWYSKNLPQGIDMLPGSITGSSGNYLPSISITKVQSGMAPSQRHLPSSTVTNPNKSPGSLGKSQSNLASNSARGLAVTSNGLKRKHTVDLAPFLAMEPKNIVVQSYYYGKMNGTAEKQLGKYGGHLKCPMCSKPFLTVREITAHIYRHVLHGASPTNCNEICDYCLKEFTTKNVLECHIEDVHTLSAERYCCRICQLIFVTEGTWMLHMWETHDELEMPYFCELCNFRCSMHTDVIDHFHKEHNGVDHVICPLCIKTFAVRTANCIKEVVIHFQKHNLKRNKKCPQCIILFPSDDEYRHHIKHDCAHRGRSPHESVRYVLSTFEVPSYMPKPPALGSDKFILPPPAAKKHKPNKPLPKIPSLCDVEVYCDDNTICLECDKDLELDGHFTESLICSKCAYATCCTFSMADHEARSHVENKLYVPTTRLKLRRVELLDVPLKCPCGFSSTNPNHVAEHLAKCKQSTAYLSNPSSIDSIKFSKGSEQSDA